MNKLSPTKKTIISLFLSVILVTGTLALSYPSFMKNAQGQQSYNNNYYKSKDNTNVNINKIKCINDNININGVNNGDVNVGNNKAVTEENISTHSSDSDKEYDNKLFDCLVSNKNTNTNTVSTGGDGDNGNQTIPPNPPVEGATLSVNKEWFVCNNDDINCIIEPQEEDEQISFEGPNSGNYTQCNSDGQCPFANDAGFNIKINGSNPTPNTIPAQINTIQQVEIGTGPFSVTETLFSNRFVPNAIFDVDNVPIGQNIIPISPALIIAFDQAGQRVFTANFLSASVSIIDLANANNVTNVPLGPGNTPRAIAFDEAGQRVFTANEFNDSVSIIDLVNSNNVTNVSLRPTGGSDPIVIAFDKTGQRVFTANSDSASVSIIDLVNSNNVTNVPLGPNTPRAITFDQAGQRVFTANFGASVSIIDLANSNNVTNISLLTRGGSLPVAIAFDQAGQRVFTANSGSSSVSIIDLANSNNVTNIRLGTDLAPIAIAFDEAGQRVFTANSLGFSVSIIDLANSNNVTNIPIDFGGLPVAIAFDAAGQRVFTANFDSDSVSIIDLSDNSVTTVPVGNGPIAIAFDQAGQRVFIANGNANSDSVSIIDLPTVAKICQDSGFDTGDISTFVSGQQTLQQITCVNFVGECSGNIENGETGECTVQDYVVSLDEVPANGDGVNILSSEIDNSIQQQRNQLIDIRQLKSPQNGNAVEIQQQGTEDSTDLTAMEKITKLKTQWLELLP